jgi:hypothetical protein
VAAACDADCDALRTLVLTVPTTFAGAAAMLRYLIEFRNGEQPARHLYVGRPRRSLVH